jgi:hypothetical protein
MPAWAVRDGILHPLLRHINFVGLDRTHCPRDHLRMLCVCRIEARRRGPMMMMMTVRTRRTRHSCLALWRVHLVQSGAGVLQKKYKPRDSGVVVTDNEGTSMNVGMGRTIGASVSLGGLAGGDYLSVSVSSM